MSLPDQSGESDFIPIPEPMIQQFKRQLSEIFRSSEAGLFEIKNEEETDFESYKELRETLITNAEDHGLRYDIKRQSSVTRDLLEKCEEAGIGYEIPESARSKPENVLNGCELAGIIVGNSIPPSSRWNTAFQVLEGSEDGEIVEAEDQESVDYEGAIIYQGPEIIEIGPSNLEVNKPGIIMYGSGEDEGVILMGGYGDYEDSDAYDLFFSNNSSETDFKLSD